MPEMRGLAAAPRIKDMRGPPVVVILTSHDTPDFGFTLRRTIGRPFGLK